MFRRLSRGPMFAAGLTAGLALLFLAQTGWARVSATDTTTIRACLQHNGDLRIVTTERRWTQCPDARRLEWRVHGEPGPAGPAGAQGERGPAGPAGASSLVSPNGLFRIDITNRGIYLRGPTASVYVDRFGAATAPGNRIVGR